MRLGELVNSGLTKLSATDSSQNARKTSIDALPMSACSRRCQNDFVLAGRGCADACACFDGVAASMRSPSCHREHAGSFGFLLDQPPDALLERDERRLV